VSAPRARPDAFGRLQKAARAAGLELIEIAGGRYALIDTSRRIVLERKSVERLALAFKDEVAAAPAPPLDLAGMSSALTAECIGAVEAQKVVDGLRADTLTAEHAWLAFTELAARYGWRSAAAMAFIVELAKRSATAAPGSSPVIPGGETLRSDRASREAFYETMVARGVLTKADPSDEQAGEVP
jgi:hypothetical protein